MFFPSGLLKNRNFQNSRVIMTSSIGNGPLLCWHFWKKNLNDIWIISKFFVIPAFIIKCDKKTLHALFGPFTKKLLQIVANRENFADNYSHNILIILDILS